MVKLQLDVIMGPRFSVVISLLLISGFCEGLFARRVVLGEYYYPKGGNHWVLRASKTVFQPGDAIIIKDERVTIGYGSVSGIISYQLDDINVRVNELKGDGDELVFQVGYGPGMPTTNVEGWAMALQISPFAQSGPIGAIYYYHDSARRGLSLPPEQTLIEKVEAPNLATVLSVPDLTLSKTHSGSFARGGRASYTLTVENIGSGVSTSTIRVTDVLPAGLSYASASGVGWSCVAVGPNVTCENSAMLMAGASTSVQLDVNVAISAPETIANTAMVTTQGDGGAGAKVATDVVILAALPPAIQGLSPAAAIAAREAFTLIVLGANFQSGSVVRWNGSPRPTQFISSTELRASISQADIAAVGMVFVTVLAPSGTVSNAGIFLVRTPPRRRP